MARSQTSTCPHWVTLVFDYSAYYSILDSSWAQIVRDSMVAASIDAAAAATVAKHSTHSTKRDACYGRVDPTTPPTFHAHSAMTPTCRVRAVVATAASKSGAFDVCADYANDGSSAVESASNCRESTNYFAEDPIDSNHAMR